MNANKGNVFWLTGISGVGKTTIGQVLVERLKEGNKRSVIFLDGDQLRELFQDPKSYTLEERKKIGLRNGRLCKFLADQNVDVVCSTISLFEECQNWNRENIENYHEVWIQTPMSIIEQKDPKNIYQGLKTGHIKNVVGFDLALEYPKNPDMILVNDHTQKPNELAQMILSEFHIKLYA